MIANTSVAPRFTLGPSSIDVSCQFLRADVIGAVADGTPDGPMPITTWSVSVVPHESSEWRALQLVSTT